MENKNIIVSIEEAKEFIKLNNFHKKYLFRPDYDALMEDPILDALRILILDDNEENREIVINRASIYFDLLKIN